MKFVPAEQHTEALIEWLKTSRDVFAQYHIARLSGKPPHTPRDFDQNREYRVLTAKRQKAWMREQRERTGYSR